MGPRNLMKSQVTLILAKELSFCQLHPIIIYTLPSEVWIGSFGLIIGLPFTVFVLSILNVIIMSEI